MNKAEQEQHGMEMAAIMTASIQNTEATIKDRIDKSSPYWTQAYEDVCKAVDREMEWRGKYYAIAEECRTLRQLLESAKAQNKGLDARLREFVDVIAWTPPESRERVVVTMTADLRALDILKIPKEKVFEELLRTGGERLYDYVRGKV